MYESCFNKSHTCSSVCSWLTLSPVGGEKVRPFWHHYYAGAQGVIFVVNSSSSDEELEQARDTLYKCLAHPALHGLPCLIIANHQDLSEARPEAKVSDYYSKCDFFIDCRHLCVMILEYTWLVIMNRCWLGKESGQASTNFLIQLWQIIVWYAITTGSVC